jgi:predicted AAA+ superfamily ATPase
MLAAVHGQVWNASQLGKSLGLSNHTVNGYLDYLEGAFLIRRLQPFYANLKKRLVKRPKVYWRDSGGLHSLLGVTDRESLLNQPWVGASWEGYVIEQILGFLSALGIRNEAYFLRTSDQFEIDLVVKLGDELWAIEAKLTASPGPGDMKRLDRAADLIDATHRYLVSQTPRPAEGDRRGSLNLDGILERLAKLRRL